jgi:hypothetical protein
LLRNPFAEAAVMETSREGVRSGGLGFDRCDAAVILDVEGDGAVERAVLWTLAPDGVVVVDSADAGALGLAADKPSIIRFDRKDQAENGCSQHQAIELALEAIVATSRPRDCAGATPSPRPSPH